MRTNSSGPHPDLSLPTLLCAAGFVESWDDMQPNQRGYRAGVVGHATTMPPSPLPRWRGRARQPPPSLRAIFGSGLSESLPALFITSGCQPEKKTLSSCVQPITLLAFSLVKTRELTVVRGRHVAADRAELPMVIMMVSRRQLSRHLCPYLSR